MKPARKDWSDAGTLVRCAASDPVAAALARDLLIVIPLGWGNSVDGNVVQNWGGRVKEDGSVGFPGDRT